MLRFVEPALSLVRTVNTLIAGVEVFGQSAGSVPNDVWRVASTSTRVHGAHVSWTSLSLF